MKTALRFATLHAGICTNQPTIEKCLWFAGFFFLPHNPCMIFFPRSLPCMIFFSFLGRLQGIFFQIFQPPYPLKSQMVRPLGYGKTEFELLFFCSGFVKISENGIRTSISWGEGKVATSHTRTLIITGFAHGLQQKIEISWERILSILIKNLPMLRCYWTALQVDKTPFLGHRLVSIMKISFPFSVLLWFH